MCSHSVASVYTTHWTRCRYWIEWTPASRSRGDKLALQPWRTACRVNHFLWHFTTTGVYQYSALYIVICFVSRIFLYHKNATICSQYNANTKESRARSIYEDTSAISSRMHSTFSNKFNSASPLSGNLSYKTAKYEFPLRVGGWVELEESRVYCREVGGYISAWHTYVCFMLSYLFHRHNR